MKLKGVYIPILNNIHLKIYKTNKNKYYIQNMNYN